SGALDEQLTLAGVAGERGRALELRASFAEAAELLEEVPAHARQEVVALERRLRPQPVHELEARGGTESHRDRHRTIQLHDGGWRELGERIVERRDARPVRLRGGTRSRVAGGDRGLQRVRAERAAELLGPLECGETTMDEDVIPARAVLIEEQDGLSRRADARARARGLDLHQRDEAVRLRREAPEQAERERDAGLGRKNRMTGGEHEAQEVVADVVIDRGLEVRHRPLLPGLELAAELLVLALEPLASTQAVDRTMLRGG